MRSPSVVAIVPCAGYGRRLGLDQKKPFVKLSGRPIAIHALATLNSCKTIDSIIVACERSCVEDFGRLVKKFRLDKVDAVVVGGRTRFESVRNCLKKVKPSFDVVLVHDGARPLVDRDIVSEVVKAAARFGASLAAVPETDTVKISDGVCSVAGTLPRERIFRAQTPQAFRREVIITAYSLPGGYLATDDSGLVERSGLSVRIVKGSYKNIKITTREDLLMAEALLRR